LGVILTVAVRGGVTPDFFWFFTGVYRPPLAKVKKGLAGIFHLVCSYRRG
jgi:hypothetical protein